MMWSTREEASLHSFVIHETSATLPYGKTIILTSGRHSLKVTALFVVPAHSAIDHICRCIAVCAS